MRQDPIAEGVDCGIWASDDADIVPFPVARPSFDHGTDPRLRDVLGEVLRDERHRQQRTLADVAEDAGVSVQYLSEVERGRKDVSSDVLDAVYRALDLDLAEVLGRAVEHLRVGMQRNRGPLMLAA